jgi:hypothetical protein
MDALDLNRSDLHSNIKSRIDATPIHDYGIIETVFQDGYVGVLSIQKLNGGVCRIECKYLTVASAALSVDIVPEVGDPVMIISMQHRQEEMFSATEPIEVLQRSGYTKLSCVAVPLGVFREDSRTKIVFGEDAVSVESEGPVTVEAESVTINGAGKGASRVGDATQVTSVTDSAFWTWLQSASAALQSLAGVPVFTGSAITGQITEGSETVEIGD